jgi:hypothetical protein
VILSVVDDVDGDSDGDGDGDVDGDGCIVKTSW